VPDALANLRDVATLAKALRSGVLLRSDAPLEGDRAPSGLPWPPSTVIDLRSQREKRERHPLSEGSVVVDVPLSIRPRTTDQTPSPAWPASLGESYVGLLSEPLAAGLVAAVTAVADAAPPVLVHCSAGKDRTGVTVAVVLRLAGVPSDEVVADYAMTAAAMPAVRERMRATVRTVTAEAALALIPPYVFAAAPDDMARFLVALDEGEGGAVGWFTSHGGDLAAVERLRRVLLARPE